MEQGVKKTGVFKQAYLWFVLVIVLILLPFFVKSSFLIYTVELIGIYSILSSALNLISGFGGIMSLGHAGFFAIGAYAFSLTNVNLQWPYLVSLIFALAVSAVTGMIFAVPALRVKGHYAAMITIGLGVIIQKLIDQWESVTNGPRGVTGIGMPTFGGVVLDSVKFYFWVMLVAGLCIFLIRNLVNSPWGRALKAVKGGEIAASSLGINVYRHKVIAFVSSVVLAGLAGVLYASLLGFISPENFNIDMSLSLLLMVLLGGEGTILGPIIGSAILTTLPVMLVGFDKYQLILYGLIFMLAVPFLPTGIVGLVYKLIPGLNRPDKITEVSGEGSFDWLVPQKDVTGTKNDYILEVSDLTKCFGGITALDKASFKVQRGKVHGLIGPNGSGKSTMLNVLSGIYKPDNGKILFANKEIQNQSPHIIAKQGLARTFQNIYLFSELSVLENIMAGCHVHIKSGFFGGFFHSIQMRRAERNSKKRAQELIKLIDLPDSTFELAKNLPNGHQHLVEIARALASEPSVVLLDEPCGGLTGLEIEHVREMIEKMRDLGITVVLIEHHMNLVMRVCDHITVLDYGRVIADGTPEQIKANPQVIKAYLGEQDVKVC